MPCKDPFSHPRAYSLLALVCLSACLAFSNHNPVQAQRVSDIEQQRDDDQALLEGLRRRQLFEVAQSFCYRQLENADLDPTTQSTLTIELMRTQITQAIRAEPAKREDAWKAIDKTLADFERAFPDHPRKFLVQVQVALSHIAHARLLRQEMDAEMAGDDAVPKALEQIRIARSQLTTLQRDIANAVPDQQARSLTIHELDSEQLLNLNHNLQFQLAECNLIRAQLYPASDRLNRIDALNTVGQRLNEVQRSTSERQPLWWKTKLAQIECARLLGDLNSARSLAKSLGAKKPPAAIGVLLLAQKSDLAIAMRDESYAQSVLKEFNETSTRTAELDLAIVRLAVTLASGATTDARKQEWISFAAELSQAMEQRYGDYWRRRADLLLITATGVAGGSKEPGTMIASDPANSATPKSSSVELDLLIRLAEESARKNNLDDAIKAYDRASKLAWAQGASEQALRVDYQAGKILEKQTQHRQAADRMTTSATRDAELGFAPSAHLIGCWNFAKSLQNDSDRQAFQKLLRDHLRLWPEGTTANQVRIWLGRELQVEKNWQVAFETYLNVQNDSPLLEKATEQGIVCARRQLLTLHRAGQPTQSTASKLSSMVGLKADSFADPDPIADALRLAQIELELVFGAHQPDPEWSQALESIQNREGTENANAAKVLRAVTICVSDPELAMNLISQIANDQSALDLGERCLSAIVDDGSAGDVQPFQILRLKLIENALAGEKLNQPDNEASKTAWRLKQSSVLAQLGRHADAVAILTELEQRHPRNAGVQMQLARSMTNQLADSDPKQPLAKWRRIASWLKPHTPNWYEAKYEVARLMLASGDADSATKLLKYIQANPPGWKNSALQSRFEKLLRDCTNR